MLVYPLRKHSDEIDWETSGWVDATCNICGSFGQMDYEEPLSLRDNLACPICGSTNKDRQLAYVLQNQHKIGKQNVLALARWGESRSILDLTPRFFDPLDKIIPKTSSIYEVLNPCENYQHVEETNISRAGDFDFIIEIDVSNKRKDPHEFHCEIFEALKKGGHYVLAVSFNHIGYLTELNSGRWLFSLDLLVDLAKIGFVPYMHQLVGVDENVQKFGIYGSDAIVIEALKP